MDANEQLLNTFSTRVRQMILHYQRVCEENAALKADVAEREGRIAELERQLDQAQKDYNALMTARMIEISDTDMESAQKRIAKLIRRIKLHLYETDLMVNVPREEEQYYRAAAKQVTETVNTYAKIYQGKKTHNDVMYMAMLDLALRSNKLAALNDTQPFMELIAKLTQEIEEVMPDKV